MNRVYFNKEKNGWFVDSLEDYYMFKAVDFETNQESDHVLSWTRNYPLDGLDNVVRVYDVEIDDIKYHFLVSAYKNVWSIVQKEPMALEKLLNDKNLFFTGDTKVI